MAKLKTFLAFIAAAGSMVSGSLSAQQPPASVTDVEKASEKAPKDNNKKDEIYIVHYTYQPAVNKPQQVTCNIHIPSGETYSATSAFEGDFKTNIGCEKAKSQAFEGVLTKIGLEKPLVPEDVRARAASSVYVIDYNYSTQVKDGANVAIFECKIQTPDGVYSASQASSDSQVDAQSMQVKSMKVTLNKLESHNTGNNVRKELVQYIAALADLGKINCFVCRIDDPKSKRELYQGDRCAPHVPAPNNALEISPR